MCNPTLSLTLQQIKAQSSYKLSIYFLLMLLTHDSVLYFTLLNPTHPQPYLLQQISLPCNKMKSLLLQHYKIPKKAQSRTLHVYQLSSSQIHCKFYLMFVTSSMYIYVNHLLSLMTSQGIAVFVREQNSKKGTGDRSNDHHHLQTTAGLSSIWYPILLFFTKIKVSLKTGHQEKSLHILCIVCKSLIRDSK